jgi:predicted nucleic-acid-binding Zn-ribbon protein
MLSTILRRLQNVIAHSALLFYSWRILQHQMKLKSEKEKLMQSRLWFVLLLGLLVPAATADDQRVKDTKVVTPAGGIDTTATQAGGIDTTATPVARHCPKCQSEMDEGFLFQPGDSNLSSVPIYWVQGRPKKGFWGTKMKGRMKQNIAAFRCTKCGYFELYAN